MPILLKIVIEVSRENVKSERNTWKERRRKRKVVNRTRPDDVSGNCIACKVDSMSDDIKATNPRAC